MGVIFSGQTRNQSTATYSHAQLILHDPEYGPNILYKNTTGGDLLAKSGLLLVRDTTIAGQMKSATSSNLADIVGVLLINDSLTLANNSTVYGQYLTGGCLDESQLILPATVTLDTVVSGRFLRDVLTGLGFKLVDIVEHSK